MKELLETLATWRNDGTDGADIGRAAEVNKVHQELFDAIRPAAAMVQVAALIDPSLLIEIEVDARR